MGRGCWTWQALGDHGSLATVGAMEPKSNTPQSAECRPLLQGCGFDRRSQKRFFSFPKRKNW